MSGSFTYSTNQQVIELNGWLDKETSPDWEKQFEEIITMTPESLVVDCAGLEYVSSAGFRLLLKISRQIRENHGRILFSSMEEHIHEVLEISGLEEFFPAQQSSSESCLWP